ncbi:MAG: hypothetical protein ABIR84_03345 [Candidatus Nitrotoga sp.]
MKSAYFDFDKIAIKLSYREVIQQRIEFMRVYGNTVVLLEGYADERGSSEYTLVLGGGRAHLVRPPLGEEAACGHIKIGSMGEEFPRLNCHEEQCWKESCHVGSTGKQGSYYNCQPH